MDNVRRLRRWLNRWLRFTVFNPNFLEVWSLRRALRRVRRYCRGLLVDVGCGDKPFYEVLAPAVSRYVGLEIPTTLAEVEEDVDVLAPPFALPFKRSTVDTVLMTQVLEHTYEPGRLLRCVHSILKPGGNLILTAPKAFALHEEPFDYYRYTPFSLRRLLEESGFEVVRLEATSPFGHMWFHTFIAWLGRFLSSARSPLSYVLRAVVVLPLVTGLNLVAWPLGYLLVDRRETLDYVVVGRKPGEGGEGV